MKTIRSMMWVYFLALAITGCGGKFAVGAGAMAPAVSYQWDSAGFDSASSMEAPAFRDMSNLYGSVDSSKAAQGSARQVAQGTERSRKLIKSASFRIRVESLEKTENTIQELLEQYGAYSSRTTVVENSRDYQLRVPAASYNALLAGVVGLGKLLSRTETAEDVTLRFYDLTGRLSTKQELLAVFQGYLGKAKNIEEIMAVETRLAELHNEIEWLGSELANLSNLIDYATINLEILGPVSTSSPYKPSIGEHVTEVFQSFGDFASAVLVILIGIVIYGIPIVLLLTVLFWLLFGKIGLLKKLWRLAAGKKKRGDVSGA